MISIMAIVPKKKNIDLTTNDDLMDAFKSFVKYPKRKTKFLVNDKKFCAIIQNDYDCRESIIYDARDVFNYGIEPKTYLSSSFKKKNLKYGIYIVRDTRFFTCIPSKHCNVTSEQYKKFMVDFLKHSGMDEKIIRKFSVFNKKQRCYTFPITHSDSLTGFISASVLILLFREPKLLLNSAGELRGYRGVINYLLSLHYKRIAVEKAKEYWDHSLTSSYLTQPSFLLWLALHYTDIFRRQIKIPIERLSFGDRRECITSSNGPSTFIRYMYRFLGDALSKIKNKRDKRRLIMYLGYPTTMEIIKYFGLPIRKILKTFVEEAKSVH